MCVHLRGRRLCVCVSKREKCVSEGECVCLSKGGGKGVCVSGDKAV